MPLSLRAAGRRAAGPAQGRIWGIASERSEGISYKGMAGKRKSAGGEGRASKKAAKVEKEETVEKQESGEEASSSSAASTSVIIEH
eukprot:291252-Hanusia_phi.AAC.1